MASPIITPMPVQTDTNYRPFSRLAVIGMILSLFSVLIFASDSLSWLLLAVILPAIILCSLAWRSIRHSEGTLAGEAMAILGVVISVGSGLGWITMNVVSKYVTESEARAAADQWILKMQKGEAGAAFLMHMSPGKRKLDFNPEEISRLRKQFPAREQDTSEVDNFLIDPICGPLLRYGEKMSMTYQGLVEAKTVRELPVYRFQYRYDGPTMQGFCIVLARGETYNDEDGVRRDWVLSIDTAGLMFRDTPYGEQVKITSARATDEVERFVYAIANDDKPLLQKMFDPKNQGDLQTVLGYIRPKGKVGTMTAIGIKKPLRLRSDEKKDNKLAVTFDCTAVVERDRAIDFSITYVNNLSDPNDHIMQNCHFLGTRKLLNQGGPKVKSDGMDKIVE